jgi:hypothetical protein
MVWNLVMWWWRWWLVMDLVERGFVTLLQLTENIKGVL